MSQALEEIGERTDQSDIKCIPAEDMGQLMCDHCLDLVSCEFGQ